MGRAPDCTAIDIVEQVGRGITETAIPSGEEIDAALLAKIRADGGGPNVDPFEARKTVEQLSQCDVNDVVLASDAFH